VVVHAQAHRLCKQALEIQPKDPRAIEVCARAACNLGNAAQARGYYAMTTGQRQREIHRFCLSKGIELAR
jgi:cytochrome c-type biogenesis protein CcmH/NrfG